MKTQDNSRLFYKFKQKSIPFVMQWELTTKCNLDCLHCCIKNEQLNTELSFDEIKDVLYQLKEENCMIQRFSGGEVFLRKDFLKILDFARKLNFSVLILSNGTLLDKDKIKELKKLRITDIQLSLYGVSPQTHDSITQAKGSFDKTMHTINLFKKYEIPFSIAAISFNKNFHELRQLKKMAKKEKWSIIFDFVILPAILSSKDPLSLRATDEQLKLAKRYGILSLPKRKDIKYRKTERKLETIGANISAHIDSRGKVSPSVTMRMHAGDLRKDSFHNIWHNSEVFKFLRNLEQKSFECFYCKYYNNCCRRTDLAYLEHGNILTKPKEICRINAVFHKGGL